MDRLAAVSAENLGRPALGLEQGASGGRQQERRVYL